MTWYHNEAVSRRLDALTLLWRARQIKGTGAIAETLNEEFGLSITGNAVAGRIHRMGRKARPLPPKARDTLERLWFGPPIPEPDPQPAREAIAARPIFISSPAPSGVRVPGKITFHQLNLRRDCKWPTGGEREHTLFCGEAQVTGRPYCKHHCGIAYGRVIVNHGRRR